ncbi:hypothetical protein [Streptomyces cavernicola]|uniref:Uncharacterized protein n=1 Tax=Streptomyces cavernicola TaxID=3043613 RepID=A0ABT6SBZ5_9ACTN|nr:hypothetical protein [Streptomyces sp. B-S-A6]MDI3405319.1 hypothetical protein [Streptomyces sp. B-S-A6]
MDLAAISARLQQIPASDSRELDRVCEEVAEAFLEAGREPSFDVGSADFAADAFLICADRYWRRRFLRLPNVRTAAACATWLMAHVARDSRTEVLEKWSLGYAFITREHGESSGELSEATEEIVAADTASGDVAYFATLYHAGKLRANFQHDELRQFLESSLLALAAGAHRRTPLFVALRAFAAFGSESITTAHAVSLLDEAWNSPERTRHVVDICLNGIQMGLPFDDQGELLRSHAQEAVRDHPLDHMFRFRLASAQHMCSDHDEALGSITTALRLLPAIGTRISHELLQQQYLKKRDEILEGRLRARLDAEQRQRMEEREAEHQRRTVELEQRHEQRWQELEAELRRDRDRQEQAQRELVESTRAATVRAMELVALFAAVIAFAVGSLQVTLNGDMSLHDRAWLIAELGGGLLVFAFVITGGTWYVTRTRPARRPDRTGTGTGQDQH